MWIKLYGKIIECPFCFKYYMPSLPHEWKFCVFYLAGFSSLRIHMRKIYNDFVLWCFYIIWNWEGKSFSNIHFMVHTDIHVICTVAQYCVFFSIQFPFNTDSFYINLIIRILVSQTMFSDHGEWYVRYLSWIYLRFWIFLTVFWRAVLMKKSSTVELFPS